jgi:hypothetical protein
LTIIIIYQDKFRLSLNAKNELIEVGKSDEKESNRPFVIRYIAARYDGSPDLEKAILDNNPDAVYVTPLRAVAMEAITNITRESKTLTITGIPEYVEKGLTLGIANQNEKPKILVNMESARLEGAQFSSNLLKLAQVID